MTARKTGPISPAPTLNLRGIDESIPKITPKSTKKEMLEAFQTIVTRFKEREREQEEPKAKVEAQQKRRDEVVESAKTATVEGIVESIGKLKLDIGNELNELSGKLISKAEQLAKLDDAIRIESERLSSLHDIEIAADSLALLIERHNEAEEEFDRRAGEKKRELEEAIATARSEYETWMDATKEAFEAEIADQRAEWQKERAAHEELVKEQEEKRMKEREREEEEYEYRKTLNRQRDEDAFLEQKKAREKELAERENALAAREETLKDLQSQVDGFPAKLDKAVAEARQTAMKEMEKQAKTARELFEKEIATERQVAALRIETLTAKVGELQERINELIRQREAADVRVQDIAVKAIEGSQRRAAAVSDIDTSREQGKRAQES